MPNDDPHIAYAFIACLFALALACVQLCVNVAKPPDKPKPPDDYPSFPAF